MATIPTRNGRVYPGAYFTTEEEAFLKAIDKYRTEKHKAFISVIEIFRLAKDMGYRKGNEP